MMGMLRGMIIGDDHIGLMKEDDKGFSVFKLLYILNSYFFIINDHFIHIKKIILLFL